VRTGRAEFFGPEEITAYDRLEADRGWHIAKGAILSELYSVIVLDEINPVLDLGLLPVAEVVEVLAEKPESLEIIATGRAAPKELIDIADLHSEMRPHHHPTAEKYGITGIEIYTGAGKGKSTSALGKALQAIGRGIRLDLSHRVLILQWLKGGSGYTEDAAIQALQHSYPNLVDHQRCGRDAIVWWKERQELDYVEAERGWEIAQAAILSGLYKSNSLVGYPNLFPNLVEFHIHWFHNMKSVNNNLGIGKNCRHNSGKTTPHIYTDFLYLLPHRQWLLHQGFHDLLLLVTRNHFQKFMPVNVRHYRYKILMPFTLTNLINTQTPNPSPILCFFLSILMVKYSLNLIKT